MMDYPNRPTETLAKVFLGSAVVILAITAVAKVVSATGDTRILAEADPLLNMLSTRQVMLLAVVLEVCAIAFILRERGTVLRAAGVAWVGTVFTAYRLGLWWIDYQGPCKCLGSVTDAIGIPPATAEVVSKVVLGYLLAGSCAILLWRGLRAWSATHPAPSVVLEA